MYKRHYHSRNNRGANNKRINNASQVVSAIRAIKSLPKESISDDSDKFIPLNEFKDFAISDRLKLNIQNKRYELPTPIQDKAIPSILDGRDIIGIANTGTGKTAAFLIPLIEKVSRDPSQKVIIILPTRELADQTSDELYGFTYGTPVSWTVCVGGKNMVKQINDLEKGPNFVIGTPGRLLDLSKKGFLNLREFGNVVLDEADRMVDMGFIRDIRYFIANLPKDRQSLFFSATIPPKVGEILKNFVSDPVTISVKKSDAISNIDHELINVNNKAAKFKKLSDLLRRDELEKVLIFGRTKWGVQKLSNELYKKGFNTGAIHGNKNQSQRQRVLDDFKAGRIRIMIATDVLSRGIDVDDISHVINYDLPGSYEDYIHRIGRTGRAKKNGVALTFVEN
ncbi:DEAD/DEAH box helicase [Candidatus Woesebacteria bacterium]|nr:DEAD/DEAH box helicase [Candidatus Woesebacteria bacterium]